jgi:hypothetical protein
VQDQVSFHKCAPIGGTSLEPCSVVFVSPCDQLTCVQVAKLKRTGYSSVTAVWDVAVLVYVALAE